MYDVIIPKMGQSSVEVDVVKWQVKVGDTIKKGALLVEIESEKTTLDIESDVDGTVAEIIVPAGEVTEVGTVICRIEQG